MAVRGVAATITEASLALQQFPHTPLFHDSEHFLMTPPPNTPNTSDADVALRIALVREMTEAARSGAIGWSIRDRRLRAVFLIASNSRAFDSSRPC